MLDAEMPEELARRDPHWLDGTSLGDGLGAACLRAALAATDDAFFEIDLATRTIRWSKAITLLLGHDPTFVGNGVVQWLKLVHPDDTRAVVASGREALPGTASGATVWTRDLRMRRADGSYAPVRARASLVRSPDAGAARVVGALSDRAPVRALEEELQEANERLALELARERQEHIRAELLMQLPTTDVLWEWWVDDDRIVWSPNVGDVLGRPATDLSTAEAFAANAPEVAADLTATRRRMAEGADAWSRHFMWVMPSGEELRMESHAYVLRDAAGRAERVIGSLRRAAEPAPIPDAALTPRQRQVLGLVRMGHTNKEIAAALGISEQAAKVQVSKLLRKFRVANRAALAVVGRTHALP